MPSELPTGWARVPLKKLGSFHKSRGASKKDEQESGVPVVRYGELYTRHDDVIRGFHSFVSEERAADYTKLQVGDLLFAGSGETLAEIGKSAVYLGPEPAHGSGDIIILRPNGRADPLFLGYASNGPEAVEQKSKLGQGSSVMHIYSHNLEKLALNVPPLLEQKKIAAILSSVDEAIQATQAVIEQTRRVKEGLLQDLLTKGIGPGGVPHTRFKQTEIGEIPQSWQLMRLDGWMEAGAVSLGRGKVISKGYLSDHRGDFPVYSSSAKGNGEFGRCGTFMFDEELITWSVDGGGRLFHRPRHKFSVTNVCGFMRADTSLFDYRFLHACLDWQQRRVGFDWVTKAHPSVIKTLYYIPRPPLDEQRRIAEATTHFRQAHRAAVAEVEALRKTKTGLLQDLLTGKVRVSV